MSESGLLETLAGHPFLSGLEQRHLATLAARTQPFTAKAGTFLAREGESGNAFYLIQTGHVALATHTATHGEVRIQTLGPGEMFGWSWLVPPYRWQFDCIAVDEVCGLHFEGEWLREQCDRDHDLGYLLLRRLAVAFANRLAATRLQLLDIHK
jgi:CRP/FNR family transcriptional regulator, cyclic AMP receptor protein